MSRLKIVALVKWFFDPGKMTIALHYSKSHCAQRGRRGKRVNSFLNFDLPADMPIVHILNIFKGFSEIKQESFNGGSWWF
jgi:hypothetical protein